MHEASEDTLRSFSEGGWGWPDLKRKNVSLAKELRKRSTDAERLLWTQLRAKQMEGLKFRRQHPIGDFIVDFVCIERKIVIELDGGQHTEETNKDNERDKWLCTQGYKVLRFWNREGKKKGSVKGEMIGACEGYNDS